MVERVTAGVLGVDLGHKIFVASRQSPEHGEALPGGALGRYDRGSGRLHTPRGGADSIDAAVRRQARSGGAAFRGVAVSPAYVATPHDVSAEAAISAILEHEGPILLDLDETLYLRNSTEDFIDSARPRLLALLLMRALDALQPWRWTGGDVTRDVWRVRLISICFPWTARRWRREVTSLATTFTNLRLMTALRAPRTTTIIVTAGFGPIVAPLVAAIGLPRARIVASRLSTFADRRHGKLRLAIDALGDELVRRALVLTDSAQDLTLLDACARPLRAVWPEAKFRQALSGVYLPGQYLTQVKRPGARYVVHGILLEDFAFWVLASIAFAASPVTHVIGLLILLGSFWAIYERGYVDNDLIAARHEAKPQLSAAFAGSQVSTPRWQPWVWALVSGAAAIALLRWPGRPAPVDLAAWAAVLTGTHAWFGLYNRLDKSTRVWLFAGLQLARTAAFVALVPIVPIGAVALGAHVVAKWVPYHVYRLGGKDWPETQLYLIRLVFFVIVALLLGFSTGLGSLLDRSALGLLAWNVYRARRELVAMLRAAHRLDRPANQGRS